MPRVVAVSSQKGGIGKTTTAANLAVAWGLSGRRVLAVDLDPQFALTRRFGRNPAEAPATAFELWPVRLSSRRRSCVTSSRASICSALAASCRGSS